MKKLIVSLLAMAALASCETAEEKSLPEPTPDNNLVPIELSAKVYGMEATTKAGSGVIETFDDTAIGVYALEEGTTDTYTWSASPYYHNATSEAVTIGTDNSITFAKKVFYPVNDKKVKFYAYTTEGSSTVTPPTDGPAAPTVKYTIDGKTDILIGTGTSGKISDNPRTNATITFDHILAKIDFSVIAETNFPADDYKVIKIEVTGVNKDVIVTLDDDATSVFSTSGSFIAYEDNTTGTAIAASGATPTAVNKSDIMLEPGATYGLTVTVGESSDLSKTTTFKVSGLTAPATKTKRTVKLTFNGTAMGGDASLNGWVEATTGDTEGKLEQE